MAAYDTLDADIERLSRRRQALWAGAPEEVPQEATRIAAKLAELFELKRTRGTTRSREEITKAARVELELERLSSPEASRRKK